MTKIYKRAIYTVIYGDTYTPRKLFYAFFEFAYVWVNVNSSNRMGMIMMVDSFTIKTGHFRKHCPSTSTVFEHQVFLM